MPRRGKVWLNGTIVAPEDAVVSVFDRGFLYGDSVYETLRVYHGTPFAFDAHLARLHRSGELVGFELPWTDAEIRSACGATLEAAGLDEAYLRIIATRGGGLIGLDPGLAVEPQLLVFAMALQPFPPGLYTQGRSACLVSVRRNLKGALDPGAKTGNYMNSVLAQGEARRQDADEAIMLDVDGRVAEASSANVFAKVEGVWCTPPLEVGILGGITRACLLEICARQSIAALERMLWPDDLRQADELLLCSSIREVIPIVTLDGAPIGTGLVGEGTTQLLRLHRAAVAQECGGPGA